jgi:hypothetical protein
MHVITVAKRVALAPTALKMEKSMMSTGATLVTTRKAL